MQIKVPSLIQGIRNAGLLVGVYGGSDTSASLITASGIEGSPVDAFLKDGIVVYTDLSMRELI